MYKALIFLVALSLGSSVAHAQSPKRVSARELMECRVSTAVDTRVTVNDVLLENNAVIGYVVGVGGFLGLWQKEVFVPLGKMTIFNASQEEGCTAQVALTTKDLVTMPEHKR